MATALARQARKDAAAHRVFFSDASDMILTLMILRRHDEHY